MTELGWCPFARQHRGYGHEGPFGYPAGARKQNRPVMLVQHRMGGYKRTLDNDVWRHENWVGVHAGIGRDGSLDQYTNIFDASWGNGIAGSVAKYDRSNRHLRALETQGQWIPVPYAGTIAYALVNGGANVLNCGGISTEHEDEGRDQPWTEPEYAMSLRWDQWCVEEAERGGFTLVVDAELEVRHGQIDGVHRTGCPGVNWPGPRKIAALKGAPVPEEDMKSYLAWCIDLGRVYFVGPNGARYIVDQKIADELAKVFGPMNVALSAAALNAIGMAP